MPPTNSTSSTTTPSSTHSTNSSTTTLRQHACATFLAGDTSLQIIPSFNYPSLGLISRPVGPFVAGVNLEVPTWLGILLRRKGLCRIQAPEWMEVEFLTRVLQTERDPAEASFSSDLPHRHAELARMLLEVCHSGLSTTTTTTNTAASNLIDSNANILGGGGGDEIPNAAQIKLLLEDIATVRMDKIRRNVHTLSHQTMTKKTQIPIIDVSGIGSLEILAVRPFLQAAFRDQTRIVTVPPLPTSSSSSRNRTQGIGSSRFRSAGGGSRSGSDSGRGEATTATNGNSVGDETMEENQSVNETDEETRPINRIRRFR